jgi:hypothetical protein
MRFCTHIALLLLGALASCGELITTEPPQPTSDNASYSWVVGARSVLVSSDGSKRRINVRDNGDQSYIVDSSADGIDTLKLEHHNDSVLLSGLTPHSFLPLVLGAKIDDDTEWSTTTYSASALLGEPDTLFFASTSKLVVYDPKRDAVTERSDLGSSIQFLERSTSFSWFAVTADRHVRFSSDRGFTWLDRGAIPNASNAIRAVEASPFSTLYVALEGGDIERFDGSSWTSAITVQGSHPINCLKYATAGPNWTLYAGTEDGYVLTLPSSGPQHAEPMSVGGNLIPIVGLALDFGGGHDRIWAAGKGAVFEGRNFGQTWKPLPGLNVIATSAFNIGDFVWIGTANGKLVSIHDDDTPEFKDVSAQAIRAIASSFGEIQAIDARGQLFSGAKQRPIDPVNTSARSSRTMRHPWVFLTKDSLWKAADVRLAGVRYTYMGRVMDHAREMKLHGKSHHDILVVRYAVERGSISEPDIENTKVPMYVVYFEAHGGPIRIETLQTGKPEIIQEIE